MLASCSTSCAALGEDFLQECQKVSAMERAPDTDLKVYRWSLIVSVVNKTIIVLSLKRSPLRFGLALTSH